MLIVAGGAHLVCKEERKEEKIYSNCDIGKIS